MSETLGEFARDIRLRLGIGLPYRLHRTTGNGGALLVPKTITENEWIQRYSAELAMESKGDSQEGPEI